MYKSIVTMLILWVTLTSYGFASSPTVVQRTWGSATPVSSSTEAQETSENEPVVSKKPTVMVRWTAGVWGIGELTTVKSTMPDGVTTGSTGSAVSMKDVIKAEVAEENAVEEMPTEGVGITESYPDMWLADTGAMPRNALYLLISLFGILGMTLLVATKRKEYA